MKLAQATPVWRTLTPDKSSDIRLAFENSLARIPVCRIRLFESNSGYSVINAVVSSLPRCPRGPKRKSIIVSLFFAVIHHDEFLTA